MLSNQHETILPKTSDHHILASAFTTMFESDEKKLSCFKKGHPKSEFLSHFPLEN
jgi:hypothetical protein